MTPILHGYIPRRGRGIQDCVAIAKRAVTRECKATRTDATHLDATRTSPSLEMIPPSLSSSPPKHAGRPLERVFVSRRERGRDSRHLKRDRGRAKCRQNRGNPRYPRAGYIAALFRETVGSVRFEAPAARFGGASLKRIPEGRKPAGEARSGGIRGANYLVTNETNCYRAGRAL